MPVGKGVLALPSWLVFTVAITEAVSSQNTGGQHQASEIHR